MKKVEVKLNDEDVDLPKDTKEERKKVLNGNINIIKQMRDTNAIDYYFQDVKIKGQKLYDRQS